MWVRLSFKQLLHARRNRRPIRVSRGYPPMLIVRTVIALLLVTGLLCFAVYIGTRQPVWRRRGILLIKWTVIAGIGFFAVLILERLILLV